MTRPLHGWGRGFNSLFLYFAFSHISFCLLTSSTHHLLLYLVNHLTRVLITRSTVPTIFITNIWQNYVTLRYKGSCRHQLYAVCSTFYQQLYTQCSNHLLLYTPLLFSPYLFCHCVFHWICTNSPCRLSYCGIAMASNWICIGKICVC